MGNGRVWQYASASKASRQGVCHFVSGSSRLTTTTHKFTFVMPTRNRPESFPLALQSALQQRASDFEIVVSNNGSDDSPRRVVEAAGDPRVRYFRTPREMNMIDSWNFALSHARGRWVTVLSDDDAVAPGLLQRVESAIDRFSPDAVTWTTWNYYPSFEGPRGRANSFTIRPFSGTTTARSSRHLLAELYAFREKPYFPIIQNCFCRRSDLERVGKKLGAPFIAPAPDYTAAAALLGLIDRSVHIDVPLRLAGTSKNATHYSPESFGQFVEALGVEASGGHAPIPSLSTVNIVPESICKVRHLMPAELGKVDVDLLGYIRYYYARLLHFQRRGFDLSNERRLLREFVRKQPREVQRQAARTQMRVWLSFWAHSSVREIALRISPLQHLIPQGAGQVISGRRHRFDDILGAVSYLDRLVEPDGAVPDSAPWVYEEARA